MAQLDSIGCKPEIDYPCVWQYRLIGEDKSAMLLAINEVLASSKGRIEEGNSSSGGRYLSLKVEVLVRDEVQRLGYYEQFSRSAAIRVVL